MDRFTEKRINELVSEKLRLESILYRQDYDNIICKKSTEKRIKEIENELRRLNK